MNPQGKVSESFGSNHSVCQERGGRAGSRSFCIKEEAAGGRASAPGAAPAPARLCGPVGGAAAAVGRSRGGGSLCKRADGLALQSRAGQENQEGKRCGAGLLVPSLPFLLPLIFYFF